VFCGKYFHNTFPVAAMFHGRHVRPISPPVITFDWTISNAEFSSISLEPAELNQSIKERGDPGTDDSSGDVTCWSKTESVFEKWWEISE
jgi:hypothetical protein